MATALGDVELQHQVNFQMGVLHLNLGDYYQAMEYWQQTLTALQGERRSQFSGLADRALAIRSFMVLCLMELGAFADGVAYGHEALQSAEARARPYERIQTYWRIGYLYVRQGTLHQAIPLLERAVALGQEADLPNYYHRAAMTLALSYALAGRAADARPLLGQIEEIEGTR